MDRREYTPTKVSQLSSLSGVKATERTALDRSKLYPEQSRADYTRKSIGPNEIEVMKEYEALKMKVRQMQADNRHLSNDIEKMRYQKNINENKYMQKVSYEEDAIAQFQKEKNYQLELLKIKNDEDTNKLKRQYEFKLDDLQRQLRNRDYHNRQFAEKNSYVELKINQLSKGVQILGLEHEKFREANAVVSDHLSKEEFGNKKLISITEELEKQKCEMENQIHVLLDIQAEKSRGINTLEMQLKNTEANQRSLHDKLAGLTQNFARLEDHITIMKERLVSTDCRNDQIEQQLKSAEYQLGQRTHTAVVQKELEGKLRRDLEVQQDRQIRRERQIEELIIENQRLVNEANSCRNKLEDISLAPTINV